ncbi:RING/U-box superfamily protein, putative isoform 1 [Theobroma cacao]|uniref:RING-type E3 ubiquitin transferase n=1 Tax=Theobroma cacao TaxID=3641 RepID=A0A061DRQ3_THECC|nr:RING/U-box superfamily protein, putative isoform 1 [Theobroma cacao]EOX95400.1 Alpha/beta-Hydrolases superfamily protein isoform 1 [Theobroma cacao]EOX95401.1 RING/U-box superfamily protein, putative isoform 1 [Theobroma cacao]
MDDSCAVCADNLEWVAYGACGHREVCSTCVARLRFICNDGRCCICKTESNVIFVTKALGDYTRMISDFSVLPSEVREGRVGSFWYHEDTQAFFDDVDHYRMIKAMCRLSCSVCDKMEEQSNEGAKRRAKFRNIEQLKGHLFHRHKLVMCSLCLEGRKVFICEQKLYTRAQLNQHINTGDSEVDGTESERGGFMGHPMCEFCKTPFYGDNELYSHMSTEHYTCHICQRQHPGQYEYYKNYDDLEIHFRRDHYLCEDEACLAKKFIVFQSEAELKRHNTMEHGGRMSRAQRNAALQIPTSFRYRRSNEDNRRGRGRTFRRELSDNDYQLSMAIEASLGTAGDLQASSTAQVVSDHADTNDIDALVQPFELLSTTDSESSARYLQALGGGSRGAPLQESSFPPLPIGPSTSQQKPKCSSEGLANNTMAAHLRCRKNGNTNVFNSAQAWPATSRRPMQASSSSTQVGRTTNVAAVTPHGTGNGAAQLSYASSTQAQAQVQARPTTADVLISSGSRMSSGNTSRISHSSSAPNLADSGFSEPSVSDFPPVSAAQRHKQSSSSQGQMNVEDVQTANKSLVEKMRAALEYDEEKYNAFKEISGQYRQGLIDSGRYLDYVKQYGLSHLVLELARLCPDAQKQKELIETYNASSQSNGLQDNGGAKGGVWSKDNIASKKGKGKSLDTASSNSKDTLADSIVSSVRKLQSSYMPSEEEVEVLSKDGYRPSKGKSKVMVDELRVELNSSNQPSVIIGGQNDSLSVKLGSGDGGGGSKQRKKTSKFHRLRLGDGSMAALLDHKSSEPDPEPLDKKFDGSQNSTGGLPIRGVWKKGGSQKLFP